MTISYKWSVESMDILSSSDGLKDVVRDVQWKVVATKDGVKKDMAAHVRLSAPSSNTFTDYSDLTKEQVLDWVKSVLDVQAIETSLANQFVAGFQKKLPWAIPEDDEPPTQASYWANGDPNRK